MPIVSAVYNTADEVDLEYPSMHSTGRAWDDIEPIDVSG